MAYVLHYRTEEGRQRWYTIGRHGSPWTPETARAEAQRLLGEVRRGLDPTRFTVRTAPPLLKGSKTWKEYDNSERQLEGAIKQLTKSGSR